MAHPSSPATDTDGVPPPRLRLPAILALLFLAAQLTYLFSGIDTDLLSQHPASQRDAVALLEQTSHQVRRKTAGTLIWGEGAAGETLRDRDTIATLEGSEAKLRFLDGTEVLVEEGSLIILEAPTKPDAPIAARLLRGSIRRTKAGRSPLVLKFSADPAAPTLKIEDTSRVSIFRVVVARDGIRVIVESGMVLSTWNQGPRKELTASSEGLRLPASELPASEIERLPAPRLMKPSIEILDHPEGPESAVLWRKVKNVFAPSAWAAESKEIAITFAWEIVPGAVEYQVQLSTDEKFKKVILSEKSKIARYTYRTEPPESDTELYFRVAAIDESQKTGDFSATGKVEIHSSKKHAPKQEAKKSTKAPIEKPSQSKVTHAKPSPKKSLSKRHADVKAASSKPTSSKHLNDKVQTAPTPAAASDAEFVQRNDSPIIIAPPRYVGDASIGLAYHFRTLKHSTGLPKEAHGDGLIPFSLRANIEAVPASPTAWVVGSGFEYLQEKATATSLSGIESAAGMSAIRFRITLGKRVGPERRYLVGVGPYLASTHRVSFQSSDLQSQLHWLGGTEAFFRPAPEFETSFQWEARAALLALGTFGVDVTASIHKNLSGTGRASRLTEPGWLAGGSVQLRASGAENSTALIVEVGHGF